MKKRTVTILVFLTLFIAASVFTVSPVHAANTWVVDPVLGVDNPLPYTGPYQHIQYVINTIASPGDTIQLVAGVYDEQVIIPYRLTIQGVGPASVIQPDIAALVASHGWWPISHGTFTGYALVPAVSAVWTAGPVTLLNLRVDGAHMNDAPGIQSPTLPSPPAPDWASAYPVGILYGEVVSGTIQDVSVVNMNMNPANPIARSYGIWLDAWMYGPCNIIIRDSTVSGYWRNGITATGDHMTFLIWNNVVTGPGYIGPSQLANGIVICDSATGRIQGNDVSNNVYDNAGNPAQYPWLSEGIMDYNVGGLLIIYNKVHNNDVGIGPYGTSSTNYDEMAYNQICNCLWGIELEGGCDWCWIHCNVIRSNTYGIHLLGQNTPYYYTGPGDRPGTNNLAWHNDIFYNYVGVQNDDPTQRFNAQYNWWGSTDGPSSVGTGSGDHVSDHVDFTNWESGPDLCAPYFTLTVSSAPATHDTPNPAVGAHVYPPGWIVTASVTSPDTSVAGTEYVCTGWSSGYGDIPASGTATSYGPWAITQDSGITWTWDTYYQFTVTSPYDTPTPYAKGTTTWVKSGTLVAESVTSPVPVTGGEELCIGWTGTGSAPLSGTGTSLSFHIAQASGVTWNWYYVAAIGGEWAPIPMQTTTPISTIGLLAPWIALALVGAGFAVAAYRRLLKKHW